MFVTDDTIAAISTAGATSQRCIVRVSGNNAIKMVQSIFSANNNININKIGGFKWIDGIVTLRSGSCFPARAYIFRNPRSYTRQDLIELHIPGSPAGATELMDNLISAGTRQAQPGEFTARAFLSGRIDLSQAQAVSDIISADDDAQLRASITVLGGRIHRLCSNITDSIAQALAVIEASIDMAEEDIQLAKPEDVAKDLSKVSRQIEDTITIAADFPEHSGCPQVVLAGRPNVGKSTLLNTLTGLDRAITSSLAGTTRDVLRCAGVVLNCGAAIDLTDAAGFGITGDALSDHADSAAHNAVMQADLILFVFDAAEGESPENIALLDMITQENRNAPKLAVANKIDISEIQRWQDIAGKCSAVISVCALNNVGLDKLESAIANTLHLAAIKSSDTLCLHASQRRSLLAAAQAINSAVEILYNSPELADTAEFTAIELRNSLAEIGKISGQVATEDILGKIFSQFCVGK